MIPKIWQVLNEDPALYDAADRFMEAADWVIMQLTGVESPQQPAWPATRPCGTRHQGYPSRDFFRALDPRLENVVEDKLSAPISVPSAAKAGEITPAEARRSRACCRAPPWRWPTWTLMCPCPPPGPPRPGQHADDHGHLHLPHHRCPTEEHTVPGMCGVVEDGVVPGLLGYEAGQSCVGDHFNWFVDNCVPGSLRSGGREKGTEPASCTSREKAEKLKPGESGLHRAGLVERQPFRAGGRGSHRHDAGHDPDHQARGDVSGAD